MELPGWNTAQVDKAAASLLKYVGQQREKAPQLLEDDELIYLSIALKKAPQASRKDKPIRIPIPHPLYTADGASICLFVRDHKGEGHKEAKHMLSKLEQQGHVNKVLGLSKLRTKFESHEAKRQLCDQYDIFLADERILPSLPKLLGKSFFKKKKQPVPVDLRAKDFPAHVKRAVAATYMLKPTGTCITVRVARASFSRQEVADNVNAAIAAVAAKLPKKWAGVGAVYLKTSDSAALPLYQSLPDAPQVIKS